MKNSTLDLNLYKAFIAVYEAKNITKAAEGLFHTSSAVGQRIKELERQLGLKLFVPHARGVRATKEADELYALVGGAIAALVNAEKTIKDFTATSTGVMRIGSSSSIASIQIKDFLCEFLARYPSIKLEIRYNAREELAEMLEKHELDIIIHRIPFARTRHSFIIEELCDHPRAFFASKSFMKKHGIGNTLTKTQIEKLPVVMGDKTREDIKSLLVVIKPETVTEIILGGAELIYSMVKNGVGVGYTNPNLVTASDEVEMISIVDVELPKHKLGVAYHENETSKAVLTFINEIKEFYKA
jgi:DNA-binding transcriptional LysR family regulator